MDLPCDEDDDEVFDNEEAELRAAHLIANSNEDFSTMMRLGENLSNSRLSLASVATVYEEDLLDDRQGMNDESETQFTQNETSRRSFDGSMMSIHNAFGTFIGRTMNNSNNNNNQNPASINPTLNVGSASSHSPSPAAMQVSANLRSGSRRQRNEHFSFPANRNNALSSVKRRTQFSGGGTSGRRARGAKGSWLQKFKLMKRHKSIANFQLSILNFGLISNKKLSKDLQSFLPKGRLSRTEFEERIKLMRKFEVLSDIEYRFADKYETYSCKHATLAANQAKNNYKKCTPYDYNRVVLKTLPDVPNSDYINASHVDSCLKPNAYIAAQGPNEETVADFWRMVWEQKSFVIVMLTKVFDFIKVMCNQYWPVEVNKAETYGNFEVTLLYEEPLADFVIRTIKLRKIKSSKQSTTTSNNNNQNQATRATNLMNLSKSNSCDDDDDDDAQDNDIDDTHAVENSTQKQQQATNPLQVRRPKFLFRQSRLQSDKTEEKNRSSLLISPGNQLSVNENQSAMALDLRHRTDSLISSGSRPPSSPSQRSQLSQFNYKADAAVRHSLQVDMPDNKLRASNSASNLFLHPNININDLNGSMSSIFSSSLSELPTPTSPTARSPAGASQGSGIDRTSVTRRAVKKKRRAPTMKNSRPTRTHFLAPSDSQLLDDDFEEDDDNDDNTLDYDDSAGNKSPHTATTIASLSTTNNESSTKAHSTIRHTKHQSQDQQQQFKLKQQQSTTSKKSLNNQNESSRQPKKKKGSRERIVYQFHYHSWASHTCPFISSLLHFRRRVRICMDEMSKAGKIGPTVVHCNDGCGRTGTYLCIDSNLELADEDNCYDIFHYTKKMRQSRKLLIENVEQYKFVYETIEEAAVCGKTWFPVSELHTRLKYKGQRNAPTKMNEYQREYEKITQMAGKFSIGDCAGGHRVENRLKNRDVSTVPPDNFRPYLSSFQTNDNTDYINAVFVDGYTRSKEYIVTEWPLHRTISDFWSLIYDHDCNSIILLANPSESSKYPSFLPSEKELRRKFGPVFSAEMVSYTHYKNIKSWIYTLNKKIVSLTEVMAGVKSETKTTQVFQITCWPQGHRVPTSTNALVELMNMVERWRQRTTYGPVCVVSLDGKLRAGVYCAANVAIEQVVQHNEVDVFQAVKTVRRHRPQLIENSTEYKYCYDLILHYVLYYLKQSSDN